MRDVPKAQWDLEREGMLCTSVNNFVDLKTFKEFFCHETNQCDYETSRKFDKAIQHFMDVRAAHLTSGN